MNEQELKILISKGENEKVEFKKCSTEVSASVFETICAFLNRNGSVDNDVTYNYQLIDNLHARKRKESSENEVLPQISISDFDEKTFRMVRQILSIHNQVHPWLFLSDEELLKSAGFWRKDPLHNCEGYVLAAVLLFGKEQTILTCLPHYRTDAIYRNIEFKRFLKPLASDPDIRYNDRELITENLILAYSSLMNFVQRNLPDKFSLDEKNINRIDLRNIIFREIVANLLIHREFSSSFEAKFLIFSDKIITENWNKPLQFGNITIENWTSHTKNPLIAKVFRELKWVEELGSGKKNILKFASLYFDNQTITIKDDDKFVFEIDFNEFTPQDTPQDKQDTPQVTPQDTPQDEQQNSTQLLNLIKVLNRDMSREELMKALSISDREHFREFFIKPALEKGWIEMTIPTKPNSKNQKYRKVILVEFIEVTPHDTPQDTPQDEQQVIPQDEQENSTQLLNLIKVLIRDMSREELMNALSISDREYFREFFIKPALEKRWIEMTIPTKPNSKNQKYRRVIMGEFSEVTPQVTPQDKQITPQDTPQDKQDTPQDEVQHYERLQRLVKALKVDMTREELMNSLSITDREHFREYYLKPALKKRWITMTIPSKPTSKNQKYRRIKKL